MLLNKENLKKIRQEIKAEFKLQNVFQVPVLKKISINMGVGKFKDNKPYLEEAKNDLTAIVGRKILENKSKKAISTFSLRKGDLVGLSATLRGEEALDFLQKLINIVFPRVRDFSGLPIKAFDKNGNFSFGFKEHIVFPEIRTDKINYIKGLQVNLEFSNGNKDLCEVFLRKMHFPLIKLKK